MFLVKIISYGTICLVSTIMCCPSQKGMFGTNTSKKYYVPLTTTTTTTTTTTFDVKDLDGVLVVAGGLASNSNFMFKTELIKIGHPSNLGSCNKLGDRRMVSFGGCNGYVGNKYVECGSTGSWDSPSWHCYYLEGSRWIEAPYHFNYTFDIDGGCLSLPEINGLLAIEISQTTKMFVIHYGSDKEKPIANGTLLGLQMEYLTHPCLTRIDEIHFLIIGGYTDNHITKKTFILEANTEPPFTTLELTGMGKELNRPHQSIACGRMVDDNGRNLVIVAGGAHKSVEISDIANNGDWTEPVQLQLPVELMYSEMVDVAPNGYFLVGGVPDGHAIYHLPCIHTHDHRCVWYKRPEMLKIPREAYFVTFMLKDPTVKCDGRRTSWLTSSGNAPTVSSINLAFLSLTRLLHTMSLYLFVL